MDSIIMLKTTDIIKHTEHKHATHNRRTYDLSYINIIILILALFTITSCEETGYYAEIPNVYVNETINLNLYEYQNLQFNSGYVYLDAGVRGIILYRKSVQDFIAFERNCTFQPMDSCAVVEVDSSSLFMIDHCCGSTFDFEGNPTSGPAEWPLKRYHTFMDGIYLKITSEEF